MRLATSDQEVQELTVYTAKQIRTMEPGFPEATAVAVDNNNGRIVDVGTVDTLKPWLDTHPHEIDRTFEKHVLVPGFIEPHLHPFLAAALLTYDIAAPDPWELPGASFPAVTNRPDYLARLSKLHQGWPDKSKMHIVWGYTPLWHGKMTRSDLDQITTDPLVIWHRSYHELVMNSAALALFDFSEAELAKISGYYDLDEGHFFESALGAVNPKLNKFVGDDQLVRGLGVYKSLVTMGGVTTAADPLAGGIINPETEWTLAQSHLDVDDFGCRTLFISSPLMLSFIYGADKVFDEVAKRLDWSTHRLIWPKAIKTLADGAFISQGFCLCAPGYIDGHRGQWITPPESAQSLLEPYWAADYDIYCHVNGDEGLDNALDTLAGLQDAHRRHDFRFSLEHFGVSREDQITRIAELGASVSTNGYYLNIFGDKYAEVGLGYQRASQITRMGSLARRNIPFAMHSDSPMGPLRPLKAVGNAVTRKTASGVVLGPDQTVTVDQAMRAVTIDAAWAWRLDRDVGSIAPGKMADFAVLDDDPYTVDPADIENIGVWGTFFEGKPFKAVT